MIYKFDDNSSQAIEFEVIDCSFIVSIFQFECNGAPIVTSYSMTVEEFNDLHDRMYDIKHKLEANAKAFKEEKEIGKTI